jgi:hypothetical protein
MCSTTFEDRTHATDRQSLSWCDTCIRGSLSWNSPAQQGLLKPHPLARRLLKSAAAGCFLSHSELLILGTLSWSVSCYLVRRLLYLIAFWLVPVVGCWNSTAISVWMIHCRQSTVSHYYFDWCYFERGCYPDPHPTLTIRCYHSLSGWFRSSSLHDCRLVSRFVHKGLGAVILGVACSWMLPDISRQILRPSICMLVLTVIHPFQRALTKSKFTI